VWTDFASWLGPAAIKCACETAAPWASVQAKYAVLICRCARTYVMQALQGHNIVSNAGALRLQYVPDLYSARIPLAAYHRSEP